MKINVKYMTKVQKIVGLKKEIFEIKQDKSIKSFVMDNICSKYDCLKDFFIKDEMLNPDVLVFYNGTQESLDSGIQLKDGDSLTFMVAIAGG